MKHFLLVLATVTGVCSTPANSQTLEQLRFELAQKQEASRKALRDAMVQLRNVRSRSCNIGNSQDCELVVLSDIELALLDIETKYQRAAASASSTEQAARAAKTSSAAEEARSKVSDLIDVLK